MWRRLLRKVSEASETGKHFSPSSFADLPAMLQDTRTEDLSSVYTLLGRVGTHSALREAFLAYLKVR